MPGLRTVYDRLTHDVDLRTSIARAREQQQDALVDECIDIADGATEETVQSARLRIWARQWQASKLAPKKYGDRISQEITGAAGGPLVVSFAEMLAKVDGAKSEKL